MSGPRDFEGSLEIPSNDGKHSTMDGNSKEGKERYEESKKDAINHINMCSSFVLVTIKDGNGCVLGACKSPTDLLGLAQGVKDWTKETEETVRRLFKGE